MTPIKHLINFEINYYCSKIDSLIEGYAKTYCGSKAHSLFHLPQFPSLKSGHMKNKNLNASDFSRIGMFS